MMPSAEMTIGKSNKNSAMLHYALGFIVVALVAAFLGFGSLSGMAATIAKICFILFLVMAVISFFKKAK